MSSSVHSAAAMPRPEGSGWVMWWLSEDIAWPTASAYTRAPRRSACSADSRTTTPQPSAITNPSRSVS